MSNRHSDPTFELLKLLSKSEKRNFKLYATRNSGSSDLKVIQLFDAMEAMSAYKEEAILKKTPTIAKSQLSNLKSHLHKLILNSLMALRTDQSIQIQLHETLSHAHILYDKGLYFQSLKSIQQAKELARYYNQMTFIEQCLVFEKRIELLYVTRSTKDRAASLTQESIEVNQIIANVSLLSNMSLQLYNKYIDHGHARNQTDIDLLSQVIRTKLLDPARYGQSFYESMYLYQSLCWAAFIQLDFIRFFRYSYKWVGLYKSFPQMLEVEKDSYIKAMHNLMTSHFYLISPDKLSKSIIEFKRFIKVHGAKLNENNFLSAYKYLFTAQIDLCFLQGRFVTGLKLVPVLEKALSQYGQFIDPHRVLIFYYKIACLYFGSGDNENAIVFLNKIIQQKSNLRNDLQCYARLLHLIAHYELGHTALIEYLTRSVYRFMSKMDSMSQVEEEVFGFLRHSFKIHRTALQAEFRKLLIKLRALEINPFERRAFVYLDIISWLESKIQGVDVQAIIRGKYLGRKKRKN